MASVADRAEAALGARGLSGLGYRGHVFWDTDIFVLPFLAATHPPAARALVGYRVQRLDAARTAAARGGFKGARFPWESADTGEDVTPTWVTDSSGRLIRVLTGEQEESITADVAWAVARYQSWSGDAGSDIFPTFLALNSNGAVNQGYLSGKYAPFKVTPSAAGISNTTNPTGQTRFENRFKLLNSLDSSLRTNAPNGAEMSDYNEFYIDAKQLMYNPEVNRYFGYTAARSAEFGSTATGNAMLVASQVLKADLGTRFIQITSNDGWDMHSDIYLPVANPLIQARPRSSTTACLADQRSES